MDTKFLIVSPLRDSLPPREDVLTQAWGELPVSYVLDEADLNEASYMDVKVNKWEVNPIWSERYGLEPLIGVEFLKGESLKAYLQETDLAPAVDVRTQRLIVVTLDEEGRSEIDGLLTKALVRVLAKSGQCYLVAEDLTPVDEHYFLSLPSAGALKRQLEQGY
ncbi:hypothetical protein [Pseudomonas maumuensis]|uniref:DUF4265 domain-containing protein n=1 Tax=Pseudomonas maumuensis TaxID=2842354 RepID=A0ABX8NSK5_9PSED|nr:hypothetical protein [Pseudomonas maumuensis]QXH58844.1 hypothetical protein KSS90_11750 [Pseudomonas maumuensis]